MQHDKTTGLCLLYDLYSGALTDKQADCFRMHYFMDLSLGEISEELSITRQAARDALVRAENTLNKCEQQFGLLSHRDGREAKVGGLLEAVSELMRFNREELLSSSLDDKLRRLEDMLLEFKKES